MKKVLAVFIIVIVSAVPALAYELSVSEIEKPYDIVTVEGALDGGHAFLGSLEDYPIMYEVVTEEPADLSAQIRQVFRGSEEPIPFSLIVVRQNEENRGVTEVARFKPEPNEWQVVKDKVMGLTFWESEALQRVIEPGIYRIEISTPENLGRYQLSFGESDESAGYFATVGHVRTTQKFFGYSIFKMLSSNHIYYPIGIIILLLLIHRTWKYRKSLAHGD